MQERKKTKVERQESRVIRSHASSGSIGRLGENNEVNGSAAPPSSSKEDSPDLRDEPEQRDNTRNDCVDDHNIGFDSRPRLSPYPPVCLLNPPGRRPSNPFRHDFVFANAASAMVLRQPVTPLPIYQSQAFDKPSPCPPSGPVTFATVSPDAPVAVTVTATASCMLLAGNCALPRVASPCLALHT